MKYIDRLLNAARKYSVWDFGWFKVALFSLGILFGAYFYRFFMNYITVIWVIFVISFIWVGYKTFFRYLD